MSAGDAHACTQAAAAGDDGADDRFVRQVVRVSEMQARFLSEHLVDTPLVWARQ